MSCLGRCIASFSSLHFDWQSGLALEGKARLVLAIALHNLNILHSDWEWSCRGREASLAVSAALLD